MLKVLICCGNGMGSSMMMVMNVEKVMGELNVAYTEYHDSVGNVQSIVNQYDVLICSEAFKHIFEPLVKSVHLMTLKNVASRKELKEKMTEYLESKK